MVAVTQTTLPPSVESSLVGRKSVLTYVQRPYLHEGRRRGRKRRRRKVKGRCVLHSFVWRGFERE